MHNAAAVIEGIKSRWHSLKEGEPGKRFCQEYERRNRERGGKRNILMLAAGAIVLAAGIFFLPAPGPGILIVALGGGMIAQESRFAARMLDKTELLGRSVVTWALGVWKKAPLAGKIAIVVVSAAVTAAAVFLAYRILFAK